MLRQVKDHLDAVRAARGWGPAPPAVRPLGRDERQRDASRHAPRRERVRELYAAVQSQHRRLAQELERSTDLLSVSEDQADRLVAALQHAAANLTPEWANTEASARRAETLRRRATAPRRYATTSSPPPEPWPR
jgi:uncharacterized membrane protein YccC